MLCDIRGIFSTPRQGISLVPQNYPPKCKFSGGLREYTGSSFPEREPMHSPSLHKQHLLDRAIDLLVAQAHGYGHPNVGCRFGYDWLRAITKFDRVSLSAGYPLSSLGATDFATFCAALQAFGGSRLRYIVPARSASRRLSGHRRRTSDHAGRWGRQRGRCGRLDLGCPEMRRGSVSDPSRLPGVTGTPHRQRIHFLKQATFGHATRHFSDTLREEPYGQLR